MSAYFLSQYLWTIPDACLHVVGHLLCEPVDWGQHLAAFSLLKYLVQCAVNVI